MKPYKFCPVCREALFTNDLGYLECSRGDCSFVFYDNPVPVAAAVIEYGKDAVILGHNQAWPPAWYGLITGFVEKHESP